VAWTLLEAAMKGLTFGGVLAASLLLTMPARRAAQERLALALGLAGVALMVANAALRASLLGLAVDALYLSMALALVAWRALTPRPAAPGAATPGGGHQA